MGFLEKLNEYEEKGLFPSSLAESMREFTPKYLEAIASSGEKTDPYEELLTVLMEMVIELKKNPYSFPLFHQAVENPIDYRTFGRMFILPLIDLQKSTLKGMEQLRQMEQQLAEGDNVIWLANHQTEPDPQAISILLDAHAPKIGKEMIFVAGHRVTTDPLAIPFSLGCNLLCIYSKKHIDFPPKEREKKMQHNRRTMKTMADLLNEGGYCIYVAPSGGRDRLNKKGEVEIAPFDPQSIELFRLMADQASHKTHFYPLALSTYHLLPPPQSTEQELGEERRPMRTPIHLAFGDEIDWKGLSSSKQKDKKKRRQMQADAICKRVKQMYKEMG